MTFCFFINRTHIKHEPSDSRIRVKKNKMLNISPYLYYLCTDYIIVKRALTE